MVFFVIADPIAVYAPELVSFCTTQADPVTSRIEIELSFMFPSFVVSHTKFFTVGTVYPTSTTEAAAEILNAKSKSAEALKLLESFNLEIADGDWRAKKLSVYEKTLVALNRKNDAIGMYQKILALKNLTPVEKTEFEKKLQALQGAGK